MKLNINFRNLRGDDSTISHIDRRMAFAFSRTQQTLQSATITISDINGPKGGIDKQCRIVLKPNGLEPIVISERQPNLRLAIDRSIARASQSLIRRLKRERRQLHSRSTLKRVPVEEHILKQENQQSSERA